MKELMLGRITKNIVFILTGMILGAWAISKESLSSLDWLIIGVGLLAFVWDCYNWFTIFYPFAKEDLSVHENLVQKGVKP